MRNQDGFWSGALTLIAFNAALVAGGYALKFIGPYLPGLIAIGLIVLVLVGVARALSPSSPPAAPPPPPPAAIVTAPLVIEPRCAVCQSNQEEDLVRCRRCETPQHSACFRYARGCGVFGCGSLAYWVPVDRSPRRRKKPVEDSQLTLNFP